jgi:hypothetical protein
MRPTYFGLAIIAVLALGFLRCWHGSKQESNLPKSSPGAVEESGAPVRQEPDSLPTPTVASTVTGNAASSASPVEEPLLQRLHALEVTNPWLAASLALEDRQRFPDNPEAEERDMLLITSLNNQRDILGARGQAWYYFMHYPRGRFTDFVSKLSGISPPTTLPDH